MNIREFIRIRAAAKYLDWAEMLPKFNGGIIQKLQRLRERQRNRAQEAYERTRPHEGVVLSFDQLALIELFPIEDYDNLERQLQRMFSKGRSLRDHFQESALEEFSSAAEDLYAGRWSLIGYITREKSNPFLYPASVAWLPELPEEVSRIEVHISKILPSFFALSFGVDLTQKSTKNVQKLLNRTYLSNFVFGGLLPTRRNLSRYSWGSSEQVMRKELLRALLSLRLGIERQLAKRIRGIFLQSSQHTVPQLPAIEGFAIDGIPDTANDLLTALKNNSAWFHSFGLTHWRTNSLFKNSNILFQWTDYDDPDVVPYRVIALRADKTDKAEELRHFQFDAMTKSLTPFAAVVGLIEQTRGKIEVLRVDVYRILAGKFSFKRLHSEIQLNNKVQLHRMILQRLQHEVSGSRWIFEDRIFGELRGFQALDERVQGSLATCILKGIEHQLKVVSGHSEMISNQFSDYVQRRNLDLTYKLQRYLFWLTGTLGMLTILVSAIAAYPVTKDWSLVKQFIVWIHKTFR